MGLFSVIGRVVGGVVNAGVSAVTGGAVQLKRPSTPTVNPGAAGVGPNGNPFTLGPNIGAAGGYGVDRSDVGLGNVGRAQVAQANAYDVLQAVAVANAVGGQYNSGRNPEAAVLAALEANAEAEARQNMGLILGLGVGGIVLLAVVASKK